MKALNSISSKILKDTPFNIIKDDLIKVGIPEKYLTDFWEMIRENLNTRSELSEIWNLCINGTTPLFDKEDLEFIKIALEIIPNSTFNKETWKNWTKEVSLKTGRKGKKLFLPLRKVLTGKSFGPDMGKLLPFLKKVPKAHEIKF